MRRKYDLRNKKSFLVIIILTIAVICIFSLFIYKYNKASKVQYIVETGSVVQDVNKNFINIEEDAILKIRWNDNYYLIYQDNKINLGKQVIIYNTISGSMKLYGTFYEIQEDGKIIDNKDETILSNTTDSKFYKLADREYLLIDSVIVSNDRSIEANNYMLVELDKQGNAKLSNNKLNLKTITPTVLVSPKYKFDIANEILSFGGHDIDLKKIIGSSNQYLPDDSDNKTNGSGGGGSGSGDGTGSGTGGNGFGSELGGNGTGGVINNGNSGTNADLDEIKDKVKMTSVIRVVEGLTQIDFDYVIYDPYNEYVSVYAEFIHDGKIEVIHLSKTDTHLVVNELNPNTNYKFNFVYTTVDNESEELVVNTFDSMELRTKMPEYTISVYKISSVKKLLTYRVGLQSGFNISKVNVNLSFNYDVIDPETSEITTKKASIDGSVAVSGNVSNSILGTLDISGYDIDKNTLLKLTIVSVETAVGIIEIDSDYTFRFGR